MSDGRAKLALVIGSGLVLTLVIALMWRFPPRPADHVAGFPSGWRCDSYGSPAATVCEPKAAK